jgi:hypothetical protein
MQERARAEGHNSQGSLEIARGTEDALSAGMVSEAPGTGAAREEPRDGWRARRIGRILGWAAASVAVLGAIAYLAFRQTAEQRAVMSLPAEERRALYRRTIQDLETVCAHRVEALRPHCQQQAEFAPKFPECDEACRKLVEQQFPVPPAR